MSCDIPEHYKIPAGVRGHAVQDVLKDLSLLVKHFTQSPLQQIHIPQVALSQYAVQHYRWRSLHLHRDTPTPQRVPITYLQGSRTFHTLNLVQ